MGEGRMTGPSSPWRLHLGNAWAFLLAWLAARSAGGEVVLRMGHRPRSRSRAMPRTSSAT